MATSSDSFDNTSDIENSPIPSVIERLGQLRPSKELLEYYRKKITEFDDEHEQMVAKLDQFKSTFLDQHKLQWDLQTREGEITELQKALSDIQVFLFQERENCLRLYAENDRLKIQELEDRKKIQHLLSLSHPGDTEITYFVKGHPSNVLQDHASKTKTKKNGGVRPHSPVVGHRGRKQIQDRGPGGHRTPSKERKKRQATSTPGPAQTSQHDVQKLLLQIEALQAQLEEQTRLATDEIDSLLEDRKLRMEEHEAIKQRDSDTIKTLTDRLNKTQTLLYDSTKDFLELKYDTRLKERKWMSERDKIMQEMDYLKEQIDINKDEIEMQGPLHVNAGTQMLNGSRMGTPTPRVRTTNAMVIKQLRSNLEQTQNMAEMYREQVIGLEDELARIREENDVGKDAFKDKTSRLTKRLQLMNQRYEALEKRRGLEVEGFKNDIKILRGKLKDVEKKLFKVTVNLGEQFDWEILHNVHRTAHRSKKLAGDLHGLKSKVYDMERELKNL